MRLRTCLCFVLLATGCTDSDEDPVTDAAVAGEDTVVPLTPFGEAGFPVAVADDGTFSLGPLTGWAGGDKAYAAPLAGRVASEEVGFIVGYYKFDEWGEPWVAAGVSGFDADTGALAVDGDMTAELEVLRDGTVALTVTAPPGSTRTSVAFECPEDERFLGFGAQTVAMEHRGARVPIWVSEQGINKGDHAEDEFPPPFEGRLYDSYYPVPFFVSPRGYGVMVENTERIVFELCSSESKAWRVEAWAPQIRLILFSGDEPLDVIERYTAHVGRPPMPPDWALLPWVAIKGGTDHVRQKSKQLRQEKIPVSAIWSEDWTGESINPITGNNLNYRWEWDPEHYPDLPGLTKELHDMDLRFMGYFNPFIVEQFTEWGEARENGWLPTTPDGEHYEMAILTWLGSVADMTHPDAVAWLQQHVKDALALGMDGYMADYAEWVPWDAHFDDGRTGAQVSSDYPRLWQKAHAEVCNGECLFFVRSGFTGSNAIAPAVWGGDQDTDFTDDDGLPTALRIGVGLGVTGVSFYGSDIAGYSGAGSEPSTQELFYRWAQMSAWSPIMRTHEGNAGAEVNWSWDKDADTTSEFRRYAQVHTRLFPYLESLLHQATQTGAPLMRHPALHYPNSAAMLATRDTYLLGDAVYVAPVVTEGATSRQVTLPPGSWADWTTGARVSGEISADAPMTEIPVYLREGAVVPLLAADVDKPAEARAGSDSHLNILAVLGADGAFTLRDGTTLTLTSADSADPGDQGLPACASDDERGCTALDAGTNRRTYRLAGETLAGLLDATGAGRTLDLTVVFAD